MISDENVNHESDSDPENRLEFRLVFLFFIKYMTDRTDILILLFRNKSKQKAHETPSVSLSLSFISSISPFSKDKTQEPKTNFTLFYSIGSLSCHFSFKIALFQYTIQVIRWKFSSSKYICTWISITTNTPDYGSFNQTTFISTTSSLTSTKPALYIISFLPILVCHNQVYKIKSS